MASPATKSAKFSISSLFAPPTRQELRAMWELCRLHNNIGFFVVWFPIVWSACMVYHAQTDISAITALQRVALYVPLCFGIKSLIMTIDDLLDYDIDALVERTKARAIPRGAISLPRAWLFFLFQVIIGVYAAHKYLRPDSLHISMLVWPIYILYPTCKRWMDVAPIPLGLMFQVGIYMGWMDLTTVKGDVPWHILTPIYIGACLWTITYETVYQHQDKVDDALIGLHSPALFVGKYTVPLCTATGLGFFSLFAYGAALNGHGPAFFAAVVVTSIMLFHRLWKTDIDKPDDCKKFFLQTVPIGWILTTGLVVDVVSTRLIRGVPL